MPKCIRSARNEQQRFRHLGRKRVISDFGGGDITADGGLLLVAEVERTCGLISGAAAVIRDQRAQGLIKHSTFDMLFQRVLLIAAGHEDAVDSGCMRKDAAIRLALSKTLREEDYGASQPTICRFENAATSRDCYRIAAWLLAFYIATHKTPRCITLDFDGSCIEAYGAQQLSCLRGHYELNMYFPLLVFDQDGWLITAVLRPGNHGEANIALPVLKRIVTEFRVAWPKVQIIFRADAAFNSPKIYDWCEDHAVHYVIGMKSNHGLNVCAAEYVAASSQRFRKKFGPEQLVATNAKYARLRRLNAIKALPKSERMEALNEINDRRVRIVGEFYYRAQSWRQDRRIVCVCDHTDRGPERRYIITNIEGEIPERIHKDRYCQRGRAEQFIKELKSLKCSRLSCQEFYANQFRLLMHSLAYLLIVKLRALLPPIWHKSSVVAIRNAFLKVAAQISESRRVIWVRWTSSYAWQRDFLSVCKVLDALPSS